MCRTETPSVLTPIARSPYVFFFLEEEEEEEKVEVGWRRGREREREDKKTQLPRFCLETEAVPASSGARSNIYKWDERDPGSRIQIRRRIAWVLPIQAPTSLSYVYRYVLCIFKTHSQFVLKRVSPSYLEQTHVLPSPALLLLWRSIWLYIMGQLSPRITPVDGLCWSLRPMYAICLYPSNSI